MGLVFRADAPCVKRHGPDIMCAAMHLHYLRLTSEQAQSWELTFFVTHFGLDDKRIAALSDR